MSPALVEAYNERFGSDSVIAYLAIVNDCISCMDLRRSVGWTYAADRRGSLTQVKRIRDQIMVGYGWIGLERGANCVRIAEAERERCT